MTGPFSSSVFGEDPSNTNEDAFAAALGRIGGKLLKDNLNRNGSDLTFRNRIGDPDLLYLDVNNMRVGVNTDTPVYDLDINSNINTTNGSVTGQANLDNVIINASGYFSTSVGALHIQPTGAGTMIEHERMSTANLEFNDNFIGSFSNSNIVLDPNGSGTIEFQATMNISLDLSVTGNIQTAGDLSTASQLIIGDSPLDVVVIAPDFTQSIIPGTSSTYDLGTSLKKWSRVYSPDLTNVTRVRPNAANYSDQVRIDGINKTIFAMQSNDDVHLDPSTGITYIEELKFQGNDITNSRSVRALNASAIAAGLLAGDSFWNTSATGNEYFLGGGTTLITPRTAKLGDIRNDLDNPGVINADDANLVLTIDAKTGGTLNEQLWYHEVIKPAVFANPTATTAYSNGVSSSNLPMTFTSSGTGYVKFDGTNAMIIPAGTSAERTYSEIGDTRWNTELNYLECYDGDRYIISTGSGEVVSTDLMTDLAITRALILT